MGKLVGLAGALTTFGAVAYLMTPLPPDQAIKTARTAPFVAPPSAAPPLPPSAGRTAAAKPATVSEVAREPRPTLVHLIQRELQRLGCYAGDVDGRWSEATRRAMQELGERVSVLRPVDTPDYIMLALARGQEGQLCGQRRSLTAQARPTSRLITTAGPSSEARPESSSGRRATTPSRVVPSEARRPMPTNATPTARQSPAAPPPSIASERDAAETARIAAAREELERLDTRRRAGGTEAVRSTDESQREAATDPANLERSRMGLGAANVDPLRAGIDPRDPSAPAILRGPPQPGSITTAGIGEPRIPVGEAPPRRAAPEPDFAPQPTVKQKRRVWQRAIFHDMQRNGP